MGWLWSSSDKTPSPETGLAATTKPSIEPPPNPSSVSNEDGAPTDPTPSAPPKSRDQVANEEARTFLKSLQAPSAANPRRLETAADDDDDDDDDDYDDDDDPDPAHHPKPLLTPSHLYPSRTNCHQHFDQAFHCQSPGGQFLNVYRYGELRNCSQHWSNFWWCVRTNRGYGVAREEREERVRRRYWEQDQRTRNRREGCSEDVWRQRRYRVDEGVFVTGQVPEYPSVGEGERSRSH